MVTSTGTDRKVFSDPLEELVWIRSKVLWVSSWLGARLFYTCKIVMDVFKVWLKFFAPCSLLKFKAAISELGSIFCVMQGDFTGAWENCLAASQNHQLRSLDLHSEVTEHTERGRIMELKGLRHRQAEFINAVKETEKSQEAGSWNKTSLSYVLIWLQRIKDWSLCSNSEIVDELCEHQKI